MNPSARSFRPVVLATLVACAPDAPTGVQSDQGVPAFAKGSTYSSWASAIRSKR